ncbi:hypothetical protein [Paractinoplanes rishiriensis]|uniref:Uncharacterized protein n=1 Tax=Paractinoplanes rishiriensis TaxID=1050105 RepID=A0A919KDB8_9ACTN|nr:hypothetical protein [Actinoplanes rishiriensis]GIF02192.1 hypothetical protein Ari01nite_96560 [Actinoplanes rishiriensis]
MTRLRALLILAGVAGLGYGVAGLLTDPDVRLAGILLFLAVVLIVHDFVWMPLVLAVGALIDRHLPSPARRPVRTALLVGAALTVAGLPFVLSPGRPTDNPSALPLSYGRNLLLILAAVALVTLLAVIRSRKKSERTHQAGSATGRR